MGRGKLIYSLMGSSGELWWKVVNLYNMIGETIKLVLLCGINSILDTHARSQNFPRSVKAHGQQL